MSTIRGRLLAMLLAGLAVVLAAGGLAVYWMAEASLLRQLDAALATRARAAASLVTFDDGRLEFEFDEGRTDGIDEGCFEIRAADGRRLRWSANLEAAPLPADPPAGSGPAVGSGGGVVYGDVVLPGRRPGRAAWLEFRPRVDFEAGGAQSPPPLLAVAALDRGPIDRALTTLLGALILVGGLVALTAAVLVTAGVRWGLAPLERLSRALAGVDGETIGTRFDGAKAPRELAPIHRELNRMLDRVERALDRERSFADAAAHELRTPLAELRTTAEVGLRWPENGRAAASLGEVLSVGQEMERLVESLLLISRGHAASNGGGTAPTALASIVAEHVERVGVALRDKGLELEVDLDGGGAAAGPRAALDIIVRNLIDNAVQYTPAGGRLAVRLGEGDGGGPFLEVENGPVALGEADLPRLFEPFWRAEGARSDRTHVGLGMAVVEQVARAIGLEAGAELEGDRLRIRVGEKASVAR